MCLYCKTLAELRRHDLEKFEHTIARYKSWFKEDDMLLRRCLVALEWKGNEDLVNDILKQIGGDENVA